MSPDKPEDTNFYSGFAGFAERKHAFLCTLSGLGGECPKLGLNFK
jgi:hypothetical protein